MQRTTRSRWWAIGMATISLVTACRSSTTPAQGEKLIARFAGQQIIAPNAMNVVQIFSAESFKTADDLKIVSVAPLTMSPGLELLDVRISFLRSQTYLYANSYPGNFCTDRWPPAGLGPTYPAENLHLGRDEVFVVTFYVRATEPGDGTVNGVSIIYEAEGRRFQQTSTGTTLKIIRRRSVEELPLEPTCNPKLLIDWIAPYPFPGRGLVTVRTPSGQP